MARLKALLKGVVEDRSPRFLWGTIALGVVLSLIAGFAVGYKYENSKGHKTAKPKPTKTTKPTSTKTPLTVKAQPLLVGAVFQVKPKQLVIVGPDKKAMKVTIGARTRFALAAPAKGGAVVAGSRVVFQASKTSETAATEVVVMPKTALLGTPVTAVTPGHTMTLKTLKGDGQVIKTEGAKIVKTGPGNRGMAKAKTRVIVQYFLVGKKHTASAVQVVILPASTSFR